MTINIYNIDEQCKQFLTQAWQLEEYHEVLNLIDTYPAQVHAQLNWLVNTVAAGGDDVDDVSEAKSMLERFML